MIKKLFTAVRQYFRVPTVEEAEQAYLAEATDPIDLEVRMKQIDRGMFRDHRYY